MQLPWTLGLRVSTTVALGLALSVAVGRYCSAAPATSPAVWSPTDIGPAPAALLAPVATNGDGTELRGPVPLVAREAVGQVDAVRRHHLLVRGESWFTFKERGTGPATLDGSARLLEYRGVKYAVFSAPLTEADKLNGIEFKGIVTATAAAHRTRTVDPGGALGAATLWKDGPDLSPTFRRWAWKREGTWGVGNKLPDGFGTVFVMNSADTAGWPLHPDDYPAIQAKRQWKVFDNGNLKLMHAVAHPGVWTNPIPLPARWARFTSNKSEGDVAILNGAALLKWGDRLDSRSPIQFRATGQEAVPITIGVFIQEPTQQELSRPLPLLELNPVDHVTVRTNLAGGKTGEKIYKCTIVRVANGKLTFKLQSSGEEMTVPAADVIRLFARDQAALGRLEQVYGFGDIEGLEEAYADLAKRTRIGWVKAWAETRAGLVREAYTKGLADGTIPSKLVIVVASGGTMITRLGIAKDAVNQQLSKLRAGQSFNIVAYMDGGKLVMLSRDSLLPVTPDSKKAGSEFLETLVPNGVSDPPSGIAGALRFQPQAIHLFSNGAYNGDLLNAVGRLNPNGRVPIHVHDVGEQEEESLNLSRLAAAHRGKYRRVVVDE